MIPRLRLPLRLPGTAASGAVLFVAGFVLVTLIRAGLDAEMGFGTIGDALFTLGLFMVTGLVATGLAWLGLLAVRRAPGVLVVIGAGSAAAAVMFLRVRDAALLDGFLLLLGLGLAAWVGATLVPLVQALRAGWRGRGPDAAPPRSGRLVVNAAVAVTACVVVGGWLVLGPAETANVSPPPGWRTATPLPFEDPGTLGPHEVGVYTYGSGNDQRRPAYADEIDFRTLSQDLRPLLPGFEGIEARLHRSYWGFGLEAVPLNGTVWMPSTDDGPFPVVLFIHGIDPRSVRSELGYAYLGELLASRGYMVVAPDMNFLGGPHIAQTAAEMPVRAWLALKHLEFLKELQETGRQGRARWIDLDRIILGGHSRGGEAAVLAAMLNSLERYPVNAAIPVSFGFSIRGVFALAPTDQLYPIAGQGTALSDVSYLVIHGSHDGDVSSFMGAAQYQRISVSEGSPAFKSSIYVTGANHSNFSEETSGRDLGGVTGLLLDPSQLIGGEAQRRLTATLVSAFAEAVLSDDHRHRALFEDPRRGWPWLPETHYAARFEDGHTRMVANFQEDLDPVTATLPGASIEGHDLVIWREEPLTLGGFQGRTQQTQVVRLGWNRDLTGASDPVWEVRLPDPLPEGVVAPAGELRFSVVQSRLEPRHPAFSLELETADGVSARVDVGEVAMEPPPDPPRLWRVQALEALAPRPREGIVQDFFVPLSAFREVEPGFDPERVRSIRLVFDRTPAGILLLHELGFRSAPDWTLPDSILLTLD